MDECTSSVTNNLVNLLRSKKTLITHADSHQGNKLESKERQALVELLTEANYMGLKDLEKGEAPAQQGKQCQSWGYEYKSEWKLAGWPLVHIAYGRDENRRMRVARGWIAIGQFAFGVLVLAQFGIGLLGIVAQFGVAPFVIAQFALGVAVIGQFALGYAAQGQMALSLDSL